MKTLKPQEVFEYLSKDWNFIGLVPGGVGWYAYSHKPELSYCYGGCWKTDELSKPLLFQIDYTGDWKDSLHCRNSDKTETIVKYCDDLNSRVHKLEFLYNENIYYLTNQYKWLILQLIDKGIIK